MTDCTGYGFGNQINLCLKGAVGNGNTADLDIQIDNTGRSNFDDSQTVTVSDWDGNKVVVDLTSILGFYGFNDSLCTVNARLTITPDTSTSGTMLLEFKLTNCVSGGSPNAYVECGGAGPHIISEMSTFDFSGSACII